MDGGAAARSAVAAHPQARNLPRQPVDNVGGASFGQLLPFDLLHPVTQRLDFFLNPKGRYDHFRERPHVGPHRHIQHRPAAHRLFAGGEANRTERYNSLSAWHAECILTLRIRSGTKGGALQHDVDTRQRPFFG